MMMPTGTGIGEVECAVRLGRARRHQERYRRYQHIAQFAHREVIRYSMPGRSPDSRTPLADEMSSHATGAVTLEIRLDSLTVAGAVPELNADSRSHRIPVSLANPMQLDPST
jgi:hypothetical protein